MAETKKTNTAKKTTSKPKAKPASDVAEVVDFAEETKKETVIEKPELEASTASLEEMNVETIESTVYDNTTDEDRKDAALRALLAVENPDERFLTDVCAILKITRVVKRDKPKVSFRWGRGTYMGTTQDY